MKKGLMVAALCVCALALSGCADKKRLAELEQNNKALQDEVQTLTSRLQEASAYKVRASELEQANQTLAADLQKLQMELSSKTNKTSTSKTGTKKTGTTTTKKSTTSKAPVKKATHR